MLLGQANNKVACFRRLNILNVSLNSKSDTKGILNTYAPLLSTNSTELSGRQYRKQVLDNTKAQKESLEMFREVGKTKKKPLSAGFPARNKQLLKGNKCWKPQQNCPPSTFSNAATTKMAEKYNKPNHQ